MYVCLEKEVKAKKILRFYFGADSLEGVLDNLILSKACDFGGNTLETAERLCEVIDDKMNLERLWGYLDGVLSDFSEDEKGALCLYSSRRENPLSGDEQKKVNRALIKFTRHARRIGDFAEGIAVLNRYYCLLKC